MKQTLSFKHLCLALLMGFSAFNGLSAQCNANFTFTMGANGSVSFSSTSTGTNANSFYIWNFGEYFNPVFSNNTVPTYTYSSNQVFTISLEVLDSVSTPTCYSVISKTIGIGNAPCTGTVTMMAGNQMPNGLRQFTVYPLSSGYSYNWDFGDGSAGPANNPTAHTYTANGVYNVSVTATSYSGTCTFTTVQTITVTVTSCLLNAGFTYTLGANGQVNFISNSTGTTANTTYYWNFKDGNFANGGSVSHTYSNGSHSAVLIVYDTLNSCLDSIVHQFTISTAPCLASASYLILKDSTQNFTWLALPSYPSNISAANWSWGDGSSSNGFYPSHTYSAAGTYSICLSITVTCGSTFSVCSNSSIYRSAGPDHPEQMVYVNVINPLTVGVPSLFAETRKISLFPNPNTGSFELQLTAIPKDQRIEIKITDLLGQVVYSETILSEGHSFSRKINMTEVPAGTYFVKTKAGNMAQVSKLVITK